MLKALFWAINLFFILLTLAAVGIVIEYRSFVATPVALGVDGLTYDVTPGASVRQIAQDLEWRGAIENWFYLAALARWQGKSQHIKAGEYHFASGIKPIELLDKMVAGEVVMHSFTIIEGWSVKQLLEAVRSNSMLKRTLQEPDSLMTMLGAPDQHSEGRFYPDTYHFSKGTSDIDFLRRAYQAMTTRLDLEWQKRDTGLPLQTPEEALILASIVEKETAVPSERPAIAGVFLRRLQQGMRLQTDPTIIYGLGDAYDGDIRRADLKLDTPYNTYLHAGLTPTPIALPSGAAIHAVLHPDAGDSLYFVARGDGSHEFSATLEEHNAAVRKYQLKGRSPAES